MAISRLEQDYRAGGFTEDQIKKAVGNQYVGAPAYSGNQSAVGFIAGSNDLNKTYSGIADSIRAANPGQNQVNTISDASGNVYNTTNMTPQQINALMLSKSNNPNASAILSSMGLDINGNQLSQLRAAATGANSSGSSGAYGAVNAPPTAPSSAAMGGQSAYKGPDVQGMKDRLNQALNLKQQSGLTGIRNARDTALQGFNSAETQAKNQAYNNRNQVAGNSALAAKRLSEILASQGIRGGDNLSANARLQAAAQGNLSQISQNESALLQDIGQKRNQTSNQAVSQENALMQESEADRINRLLDLEKYGNEQALNVDNINYSRYRDTVGDNYRDSQADLSKRLQEAALLGTYNGTQTLQSAAQQFNQGQQQKQFDRGIYESDRNFGYQQGRDTVGDQRWNTQFDYQQGRDQVGDQQWQQNYGLNERQTNASLANQAADNELQRLRYAAEQNPNSLENQYKQAQIDALNNKTNTPDVTATMKQLESQYVQYDNTGNPSVTNPYAMRNSIIALGLPDGETIKLLNKYNLPIQATNYGGGR